MDFLTEKDVPHLEKGEKGGSMPRSTGSAAASEGGEASFYLKLLCNKSSEWSEVQVVDLDPQSGEFGLRTIA